MAQKRSELLKNSNYLSNLTTGLGLNGATVENEAPLVETPSSIPEKSLEGKKVDRELNESKQTIRKDSDKELKPKKQVKRITLEIKSDKRRTAGFHIFPEYENAIEAIRMNGHHKNKGMALEMLVNFYLSHIDSEKRENILKTMTAPKDNDEW
ncbi:hypothetical protein [Pontibacter harenae]|uniref:hypothetical protein n=1 Tax=Pontibacter harenae TaxID=2894083 RepID=UPI001E380A9E|nr:hypothetical protein [Pontibacter harenae]MCC9168989.1 hypothetical protein [Pontibacter harenae]